MVCTSCCKPRRNAKRRAPLKTFREPLHTWNTSWCMSNGLKYAHGNSRGHSFRSLQPFSSGIATPKGILGTVARQVVLSGPCTGRMAKKSLIIDSCTYIILRSERATKELLHVSQLMSCRCRRLEAHQSVPDGLLFPQVRSDNHALRQLGVSIALRVPLRFIFTIQQRLVAMGARRTEKNCHREVLKLCRHRPCSSQPL